MNGEKNAEITFPVGYYKLHNKQLFNFTLNRWYSIGYARLEDMLEAGKNIKKYEDWKPEMVRIAYKALSENRLIEEWYLIMKYLANEGYEVIGFEGPGQGAALIKAEKIEQDVLFFSGENDYFIPIRLHDRQVKALVNAKSVTDRIFTKEEHAQNHCQIGNIKLALDVIAKWIEHKLNDKG